MTSHEDIFSLFMRAAIGLSLAYAALVCLGGIAEAVSTGDILLVYIGVPFTYVLGYFAFCMVRSVAKEG